VEKKWNDFSNEVEVLWKAQLRVAMAKSSVVHTAELLYTNTQTQCSCSL